MTRDSESLQNSGTPERLSENTLRHFGFAVDPFAVKHNPKFLLRSKPLRSALESLHQCVGEGAKLLVVVGESGSGRTALVDAITRDFKDGIRTARIDRPTGTWTEIGAEIGRQLRLRGERLSPGAMSADSGCAQTYRVMINHAEEMSVDSIKHLGAYLDLEAAPGKLVHRIQVILMTQDDMGAGLSGWLTQRDYAHVDLELLGDEQSRRYIARRAQLAQSTKHEIFMSDALSRIAQLAAGNPGHINRICRAALELAASRGSDIVDAEAVGTALRRKKAAATLAPEPIPEPVPEPVYQPVPDPEPLEKLMTPPPAAASAQVPIGRVAVAPPMGIIEERQVARRPEVIPPSDRESARNPRVEVISEPKPRESNSVAFLAAFCALLLGIIAGGAGFLYYESQTPPPEPQIVEVPVEKIVEVPVEVPVEVVRIVKVEVPKPAPKPKPKPRKPKRKPVKVAKVKPPPPPAALAPKPKGIGPIPVAAEALERAFANARPGNHVRRIEILKHGDRGTKLVQTLDLARMRYLSRTMTVGVLTGDVSSDAREVESRFLSIETGEVEDDRFGFRPARGTVEGLKAGKGKDPFYGSSFGYDDFRVRKANQFIIHGIDRTKVGKDYFYSVSAKPRFQAPYERVEYTIHAANEVIVEAHYFRGRGLRPYRIVQYPLDNMERHGDGLVAMRMISRDFVSNAIEEARVVKVTLNNRLDRRLFTLDKVKSAKLKIPNL